MNTLKSVQKTSNIIFCVSCAFLWLLSSLSFAKYSGGTGEPNDPYQIGEVNDLLLLGEETGDYDKYFILIADINLDPNIPGNRVFDKAIIAPNPLLTPFSGIFDGTGHKIRNLTINGEYPYEICVGLFGYVYTDETDYDGCEIKNLGLEGVNIIGLGEIGGLAGANIEANIRNCYSKGVVSGRINCHSVGGLVGINSGSIINCYSEGVVSSAGAFQHPGSGAIGGLVGGNSGSLYITGIIIDSWSSCDVVGGDGAGSLGGLVGVSYSSYESVQYFDNYIYNCYSTGTVRGYNSGGLGGLVGFNAGIINKCFSISPVIDEGVSNGLGGLVGSNGWKIFSSFSSGDVNGGNGSSKLGGLVGDSSREDGSDEIISCYSTGDVNGGINSSELGGLVGHIYDSNIINCFSSGDVNGGSILGGLVGSSDFGNINSSYFLDIIGPNNGLGTQLTETQMKQRASFSGWEFVLDTIDVNQRFDPLKDVWSIKEDVNYPVLVWPLVNLKSSKFPFGWYEVDFCDFAMMVNWWRRDDCADNNDCNKADFDLSGTVDLYDLKIFTKYWLDGTID